MSIRKFGAPASSHDRRITAEDVEIQACPISEQQEDEKKDKDDETKDSD